MEPLLVIEYRERVVPALMERFGFANIHQVPRLEKIVINSCVGKESDRKQAVEDLVAEITLITGQRPIVTHAKKSVSNFRLREGDAIGAKVTLRGRNMYDFLLRLMRVAIPAIRDFRGISTKGFDGRGNYTMGINDQAIFPEIELDKVKRTLGFDITFVTSATTDEHACALLEVMGMPFRRPEKRDTGDGGGEAAA